MPRTHQSKAAEGPMDPLRSEVTAQILGVTRARVYQHWEAGRLRAWRARGTVIGLHGEKPSFFYERNEVETLAVKLQALRRLQAELGHKPPGPKSSREMPTEWEECIPPGKTAPPEKGE